VWHSGSARYRRGFGVSLTHLIGTTTHLTARDFGLEARRDGCRHDSADIIYHIHICFKTFWIHHRGQALGHSPSTSVNRINTAV
jgi:hypothetical protein